MATYIINIYVNLCICIYIIYNILYIYIYIYIYIYPRTTNNADIVYTKTLTEKKFPKHKKKIFSLNLWAQLNHYKQKV